jgi:hypothetical protein
MIVLGAFLIGHHATGSGIVHAATLTFQDDTSDYTGTVDTFIQEGAPATNHGSAVLIGWDELDLGGENFALIRFDNIFGTGPGLIAPTDTITSATLTYEVTNPGADATVNQVLVDWNESDTYNTFGGEAGVQADEYGASVAIASGATGTRTINVASSIDAWKTSPSSNKGWIFRPSVGTTDGVDLHSSEGVTIALRPLLTVVVNEGDPLPAITRGPYLQLATPTSIFVRWRTDLATDSRVRYGSSPASLTNVVTDPATVTEHEINVTSLSPNTQYYYDVGTTSGTLAGGTVDHFFYTSPNHGTVQPVRTWVIGDSGTANANARAVRDAYYNFTGSIYTDVWLLLGDNAYNDGTDGQYQAAVFETYQDMLIQTVFWATRGNHEKNASVHYGLCTNPTAAEAGGWASGTEAYFSFDYANIHFICLDSYVTNRSPGGAMMTWLTNDLANTLQTWIIAYWHHPPYSKGSHNSDTESNLIDMRQNALPILEAGGADLVLSGHSHSYERSFLINGHYDVSTTFDPPTMLLDGGDGHTDGTGAYQKESTPNDGTVYIVMGSSGKTSGGSLNHPVMYFSANHLGSLVLDIDNLTCDIQMIRETGVIDDYLTISKQPPAPNIVLNKTTIDHSIYYGNNLTNETFTVANGGPDTINYTITDDLNFLSVNPNTGDSTGEEDIINIIYDNGIISALPVGQYPGTITVAAPEAYNTPQTIAVNLEIKSVAADFDDDTDVDQEDFGHLQMCLGYSGTIPPACQDADLDGSNSVNQSDFTKFNNCISGANIPADPICEQ